MSSLKVMVTGATGFLGSSVIPALQKNSGFTVYPIGRKECDLSLPQQVRQVIQTIQPDIVLHLAGLSKVSAAISLEDYFLGNVCLTQNLLTELQSLVKPIRFVLISSVHIYGHQTGVVEETALPHPQSAYAFSKFLAEEAVKKSSKSFSHLRGTVVRLSSCLGPGQPKGFVASDLSSKLKTAKTKSLPSISTGPLNAFRQFSDQRDIAEALSILLRLDQSTPFEIFNLANPEKKSVQELLNTFLEVTHLKLAVSSEATTHNPFNGLEMSTAKFHQLAPSFRFRPLRETLQDIWKCS
ncbi:SDR family oxidoreductase [bacterium]|nr:SDR family oxidoreductase [bacterium]NBW98478.1 SDR family oxidoreductase [bacterium]NBX81635.1 SDR family oxidoreductase [bacterium]